ncbi:hypothetical protein ACIPJK_38530 [Streptomyces roseus]
MTEAARDSSRAARADTELLAPLTPDEQNSLMALPTRLHIAAGTPG